MSQELNNFFRSDPFGFAKANVLWPGDPTGVPGLEPNVSTSYFKAHNNIGSGESLYNLVGAKRIWSGDLNRVGSKVVLSKTPGAVVAPRMAIYYLPWAENKFLRTTLRSTRNQALRGAKPAIAANAANNAAIPPQDTNDPDIFFTANVNGCMVVVEGTREEPTVYHCNAIAHAGSPLTSAVTNQDSATAQNQIGQKVNWMTTRMDTMSLASPKNPRGVAQTAAPRKATNQNDYMVLGFEGVVGAGQEEEWARIKSGIVRMTGLKRQSDTQVRIQESVGSVFGHRLNGLWTFYFQKLVCYQIWKKAGTFKTRWQPQQTDLWWVADCREFWPNGAGHAV